jgi:ribosomal protein S18 acetylase RimI-like enzyme
VPIEDECARAARDRLTAVRVRAPSEIDIEAALELFSRLDRMERPWRIFTPRRGSLEATKARYMSLLRDQTGIVLLAHSGQRTVGLGVGQVTQPSSYSDARALEISNVYVDPSFRGRGIATRIVARLVAYGSARGLEYLVLRVFAPNHLAAAFWAGMGFRPRLTQFVAPIGQVVSERTSTRQDMQI